MTLLAILLSLCGVRASAADSLRLPHPSKSGPDPDFVPFTTEFNGVLDIPWGEGNASWPEQLFWDSLPDLHNQHLQEMVQGSEGVQAAGKVPVMSCVAWGYEYKAATGGDSASGIADKSHSPGWQQWGEWLTARKDKYFAQDWDGGIFYPWAGYVTPMMPLDKEDWPAGIDSATFGDFAGARLGTLANKIHSRGFMAADFVVGLYGGNHDFHPRVIDAFERWAGVTAPGATVKDRAAVIKAKYWSLYSDYKCHLFARFYARAAETIRSAGREPLVGGQILPMTASVRGTGNDFRIYLQHLPAKNWFFEVELQSDEGRPVANYWERSTEMGAHAGRAPEFQFGAIMDAYQSNFWGAVLGNNKKDSAWGRAYMKHAWLSVGWAHVAKTDGSVRRATMAMQRSYWDGGGVDTSIVALMRNHIPRHPFGPALYYSTDLERQSENTGNPNFYYWFEPNAAGWMHQGVPTGYTVSDTALANLAPANKPSGWFVYVDNLGLTHLDPAEKARLEAIAPILQLKDIADSCPVSFEGDSLGGYGFIDQNGSVIVVSSNSAETKVDGAIRFAKVEDGTYPVRDLLTGATGALTIAGHRGRMPVSWEARDTRVFEIGGLRELGRAKLVPWNRPALHRAVPPGVRRVDGIRLDALGRRFPEGPSMIWNAPVP